LSAEVIDEATKMIEPARGVVVHGDRDSSLDNFLTRIHIGLERDMRLVAVSMSHPGGAVNGIPGPAHVHPELVFNGADRCGSVRKAKREDVVYLETHGVKINAITEHTVVA
jgi:hypothetical protein